MSVGHGSDLPPAETRPRSIRRFSRMVVLPLVIFAVLSGLFLLQLLSDKNPSTVPSALIDRPAPDLTLPPVPGLSDGGTPVPGLARADLLGRVSVVNVFASWCAPCRVEHPLLSELAEDTRIQVIGVNYKDKPANARRFLNTLGNPYVRVGADENGRAAIDWGVYGVPETFIVDPNGVIRYKFIGPLAPDSFRDVFRPALERIIDASE